MFIRSIMKTYLINMTDAEHHKLKLMAATHDVTMKKFIEAAVRFYIDSIQKQKIAEIDRIMPLSANAGKGSRLP